MPDTDATHSEQDKLQDGTGQVDYVTNSPMLASLFSACGWKVQVREEGLPESAVKPLPLGMGI